MRVLAACMGQYCGEHIDGEHRSKCRDGRPMLDKNNHVIETGTRFSHEPLARGAKLGTVSSLAKP